MANQRSELEQLILGPTNTPASRKRRVRYEDEVDYHPDAMGIEEEVAAPRSAMKKQKQPKVIITTGNDHNDDEDQEVDNAQHMEGCST